MVLYKYSTIDLSGGIMRDKAALYYNKWDQNESYNVDEVLNLKQQHILNLFDYDVSIVMLFNESLNVAITKAVYIYIIFGQLFRKQIELRKAVARYS